MRGELTGSTATTLRMNGEEYDVTVSGDEDVATSLDSLRSMQLPTATGGNVPLSSVADVYTELSPQSIVRKNQKETVTITGESESGDANAITEKVNALLDSYEAPEGVEIGNGDTMASQMAETTGSLMLALAVAIALVYFILATQFNSFALPVATMLILPIGLLGSMILARADRKPCVHGRAARCYHSGRYGRKLLHRPHRLHASAPGTRRG